MVTSRAGTYEITPVVVNGAGLAIAWLVVGRRGPRSRSVCQEQSMMTDTKEAAWTH